MIVNADTRIESTLAARRPGAAVLSAGLHVLVLAAWVFVPSPEPHDLGAGVLTVEVLLETPPPPEPEAKPEPPAPPPPEPAKPPPEPEPQPKPKPVEVKPPPKPAPRPIPQAKPVSAATPTEAPATTETPAAQPVMSDTAAASATPAAGAVALGNPAARQAERNDYLRMVWARIMRFRPDRVRLTGTTRLSFALGLDGSLLSIAIAESSGSDLLDRAAEDAVRRAAPFPPPPAGSVLADLAFSIPFQFRPAR